MSKARAIISSKPRKSRQILVLPFEDMKLYTVQQLARKYDVTDYTIRDLYKKYLKKKLISRHYLLTTSDVKKLDSILT